MNLEVLVDLKLGVSLGWHKHFWTEKIQIENCWIFLDLFYIFVTFPSLFCYSQVHREANQTLDTFVEKKFKEDFCCRKLLVAAVNRCVAIQADRYCHLARTKHQGGFMQNELEEVDHF